MITGPTITRLAPKAPERKLRPEDEADLEALLEVARRYPASYDRKRIMAKADAILDRALDGKPVPKCALCEDTGCEFCPGA